MKENTKKTLKYYWKNAINYKLVLFITFLSTILGNVFDTIIPVYFKNFFNVLSSGQEKLLIVNSLLSILLVLMTLALVRWLSFRVSSFAINHFESGVMADLTNRCFAYLHQHSFSFFSDNFTGSLVKRVRSFVSAFEVLCDQFFFELLPSATSMVVMMIVLFRVNWMLAIGMLLWFIFILIINWFFTKYKLKFDIQRSEAETKTSGYLADSVSNSTNIKLFNGFKYELESFFGLNDKVRKLKKFTWDLGAKFEAIQSLLTVFLEVGLYYLAIRLWNRGLITIGDFVLIQAYIMSVVMMAWRFGRVIRRIYENLAEAEEMTIILNIPHGVKDVVNAKKMIVTRGKIEYKKVDFGYDENKNVINNLDLIIKPKETVALIGSSGSGKTTLIKLLLRLYNLRDGKILIDNQNIAMMTQNSLRNNISLVPQDPVLFHRSLMDNIRYGKFEASESEVVEAAKLANCHQFISQLKDGYNTFVGERGIKLSGGERQRVAIARAILRNTPILLLDEATSSLDSESEKLIQDALEKLMKNKTVIIVAHRLSTIKKADRVVVMDNGKIVEAGNHLQLVNKENGIYKKLWELQVGGFIK